MTYLRNYKIKTRAAKPELYDRNGVSRVHEGPPKGMLYPSLHKYGGAGIGGKESCFTQVGRQAMSALPERPARSI